MSPLEQFKWYVSVMWINEVNRRITNLSPHVRANPLAAQKVAILKRRKAALWWVVKQTQGELKEWGNASWVKLDQKQVQTLNRRSLELLKKHANSIVRVLSGSGVSSGFYVLPNMIITTTHWMNDNTIGWINTKEIIQTWDKKRIGIKRRIDIPGKDLTILITQKENSSFMRIWNGAKVWDYLHHFGMWKEMRTTFLYWTPSSIALNYITHWLAQHHKREWWKNEYWSTNSYRTRRVLWAEHISWGDSGWPITDYQGNVQCITTDWDYRNWRLQKQWKQNITDTAYCYWPDEMQNAIRYAKNIMARW